MHPKGAWQTSPNWKEGDQGSEVRKKGSPTAWHGRGQGYSPALTRLKFNQFGLHATLAVKTIKALYYKAGGDRELIVSLGKDLEGKRPDQMFYCTKLNWLHARS